MSSFMITTSATDETAKAAEEFINWWMTGTGLEACETTQDVDYSNVTPNADVVYFHVLLKCISANG